MREPDSYTSDQAYLCWAQENKKRADRLLAAAKAIRVLLNAESDFADMFLVEEWKLFNELHVAAMDYEIG